MALSELISERNKNQKSKSWPQAIIQTCKSENVQLPFEISKLAEENEKSAKIEDNQLETENLMLGVN